MGENSDIKFKKDVYTKNIVYGTASNFQADILRSEFQGQPFRGNRGFGVVIVDEVDSMLFDQRTQSTSLSERQPAMDHLELVSMNIWNLVNWMREHIIEKDGKYLFIPEDFSIDEDSNIVTGSDCSLEKIFVDDAKEFLKQKVQEVINENLRYLSPQEIAFKTEYEDLYAKYVSLCKSLTEIKNEMDLKIKDSSNKKKSSIQELSIEIEHLEKSTQENREPSIENCKLVQLKKQLQRVQEEMEKEVDSELFSKKEEIMKDHSNVNQALRETNWVKYVHPIIEVPHHLLEFAHQQIPLWVQSAIDALCYFQKNKHYAVEDDRIVPISYSDTEVFQPYMVWGNGLTQFLQIKEGLKIQPESVATNYLSTHGFFKRYGCHLYGVTGTLGKYPTQQFFRNVYETDQIRIPAHSYRMIMNKKSFYKCKEFPAKVFSNEES